MEMNRREFIRHGARGAVLTLAYSVGGSMMLMTPAEAHAKRLPWRHLSEAEVKMLETLAEAMVPGSSQGGVSHFIDQQLGVAPDDCLLIAKYFQVPPPYLAFYRSGLAATAGLARREMRKDLSELNPDELHALVGMMSRPGTKVDQVDVSLFYLCLRSDAVDMVYGTPLGFEKLDVPLMAHIMPPERWNA